MGSFCFAVIVEQDFSGVGISKAFNISCDISDCLEVVMMSKSKIGVLSIIILLLVSSAIGLASAAYETETVDVDLGSSGHAVVVAPISGVTFVVDGTPGAIGSITLENMTDNPHPLADIPSGIALGRFVQITFDMIPSEFTKAQVVINYTDSDVADFNQPFSVYKYLDASSSYVELPTTTDTSAKTVTVTLNSVTDPILAIGGSTGEAPGPDSTVTWIIVAVSVVIVVVLAVFIIFRWRKT